MSGHIRRRSANSWELKFDAGVDPATGQRATKYRSFKGTKRAAQAKLVELLNEAACGTLVDHSKETLSAFLTRWARDWAAHNASPKTRERWGQLIDNQITPRLGAASLQRIKPSHLAELYSTLMREGAVGGGPLAARTVNHVHRLLHRALGHAVTWELIHENPAARAHPPQVAEQEIEIPSETEVAAVLGRLRGRSRPERGVANCALYPGRISTRLPARSGLSVRSKRPQRRGCG
jgi:Phage integrase, N-terminal SAM-like domain